MSSLPLSVMTHWPATAELDHSAEAWHEGNKSSPLVPRWTNPIWTTHTLNTGIPPFHSLLFSFLRLLIQSDRLGRFARILCFPGQRSGKAGGKSLTSSNSLRQTTGLKGGAKSKEKNPPRESLKQAARRKDLRSSSNNDDRLYCWQAW